MIKFVLCFPFSLSYVFVKNRTKGAPPPPQRKKIAVILGTIQRKIWKQFMEGIVNIMGTKWGLSISL
jgi:hypothetical protein